jgi:hypothetical protein
MGKYKYSVQELKYEGYSIIKLHLPSGQVVNIHHDLHADAASIEARINEWAKDWGGRYGLGRYRATRQRPLTYAQLNKKRIKSSEYTKREIKKILDGIYLGTIGGAIGSHKITLDDAARAMLNQELSNIKFNDYTGNLYNSYQANIISNGRLTTVLRPAEPKKGLVFPGGRRKRGDFIRTNKKGQHVKNPSRWSPLLTERHKPSKGTKLKNGTRIRYLHKYEKSPNAKGYSDLGLSSGYSTRGGRSPQLRIGRLQGSSNKGSGLIKSGIVLENTAPYADAVQLRYQVLNNSLARRVHGKYGGKGATLARVMTKRMLKEAGFNVK